MNKWSLWGAFLAVVLVLGLNSAQAEIHTFEGNANATVSANTSILTTAITPDARTAQLAVTVGLTNTNSVINVIMEDQEGGTNRTFSLNSGTALSAGASYAFSFDVSSRFTYNFQPATETDVTMVVRSVRNER